MKLTKKDLIILKGLAQNSRMTLTNLSRATKIPISTIFDKLREMESELGLKYIAVITKPENIEV